MGRRGPPPKPTAKKKLEGTYRKDRAAVREPEPPRGVPEAPERLSARALGAWERIGPELERMGVLTVADGVALELLCDAYAEYVEAREEVRVFGQTYQSETQTGVIIRPHPAVGIASDAWRRVHRMLLEFGLTPAARTRVNAEPDTPEEEDPWRALQVA